MHVGAGHIRRLDGMRFRVEPKLLLTEGATVGWEGGEVGRNGQGREGIGREGRATCRRWIDRERAGKGSKVGRRTGGVEEKLEGQEAGRRT